jgi:hypothetical protein
VEVRCGDDDVDAVDPGLDGGVDVLDDPPGGAADLCVEPLGGDELHGLELSLGDACESGLDDLDPEGVDGPGYAELLLRCQGDSRGLFPIAEGCV